jgi:3-deoxy-7-phosphoheptulonate synthase
MRVYVEKPRTVTGWTGLVSDPCLDGSCDLPSGLRLARRLLLDVTGLGLPAACEWVDPVTAPYLSDLVAWGAIGARTSESPVHRHLASGLSMPVGFKNSTDGDIQVAAEACLAAASGHTFAGITPDGTAAVITTTGNPDCHIVLRGGRSGPNFEAPYVAKALGMAVGAGLARGIVVDASHGNSGKDHHRQAQVAAALAAQVAEGVPGLAGVMLESFLAGGRQELAGDPAALAYGLSVTDACMDWEMTAAILRMLAGAVRRRRVLAGQGGPR